MTTDIAGRGSLVLAHVGIVVFDLIAAADDFERRWGWSVEGVADISLAEALYCGTAVDISFRQGFVRQARTDLKLIQPLTTRSPYNDFLKKRQADGVHHLAYVVEDIDVYLQKLRPIGGELVMDARLPAGGGRLVQIDGFAHGPSVELIQRQA